MDISSVVKNVFTSLTSKNGNNYNVIISYLLVNGQEIEIGRVFVTPATNTLIQLACNK